MIQEVVTGGDVGKDGRLQPGDQILEVYIQLEQPVSNQVRNKPAFATTEAYKARGLKSLI